MKKYNCINVFQISDIKDKSKETCIEKYGTPYYNQSELFKYKYIENYFKKYGVEPIKRNTEYQQYRNKVTRLTNKNKKSLYENWNGLDFYDDEYIKNNFDLQKYDRNYPTIDHKISVCFGFNNNITEEEISNINNLCITKKYINSSKNKNCEYERKEKN
jgi:hypothetical protein